ncbi:hypothetical protein ERJ75_001267100 [Trypanosoma vivax]|nr:hypothetical protein ERJ75_001267100 [Trypanosoma vivax]
MSAEGNVSSSSRVASTSEKGPSTVLGITPAYRQTRDRVECPIAAGVPQKTPFTVPPKSRVMTLPQPRQTKAESATAPCTFSSPERSLISTLDSRSLMSRTAMTGRARTKVEIKNFDMETAYAALLRRLNEKLDDEEIPFSPLSWAVCFHVCCRPRQHVEEVLPLLKDGSSGFFPIL